MINADHLAAWLSSSTADRAAAMADLTASKDSHVVVDVIGSILGLFQQNLPKADIVQFDFQPAVNFAARINRWRARLFADLFLLKPATLLPERDDPSEIFCGGRP